MSERVGIPSPSHVPERPVRTPRGILRAGISDVRLVDDWWLALLWVADDDGLVPFRSTAPASGPPADPPLARLGPSIAGGLSGLVLEEGGRQMLRLRLGVAPADDRLPWETPLVVVAAFRWEPMRAATMTTEELANEALDAFARSVEGLARA
ncbi:MAG TPA: hypothetical protein VF802_00490 [Candidatus Limnocylindrales bacterium]